MNDENAAESATGPQGPRGEQGIPGVQGPPGEQPLAIDETIKVIVADAMRESMRWRNWAMGVLGAVILVLAANSGYLLQRSIAHPLSNQLKTQISEQQAEQKALDLYVQQYAQHGCQALELLTATPVPKPANPAANPSRETTYEFYQAILYWEHADGCTLTVHQITPPVK